VDNNCLDVKPVQLPASLSASSAADFKQLLVSRINEKGNIPLDGGKVESADSCGMQMLLCFIMTRKYQNEGVRWVDCSETLYHAACLLGMRRLAGLADSLVEELILGMD